MNPNQQLFNENNPRDKAFLKNMDAISNRRVVQYLRTRLFQKVDFQPKNLKKENLLNSKIMHDIYDDIQFTVNEILDLLYENKLIYNQYFMNKSIETRFNTSCKDILLPGEDDLYYWDIHYYKWLTLFYEDNRRAIVEPLGYLQKLYEFIIKDMTYGDVYDTIHIIDEEY